MDALEILFIIIIIIKRVFSLNSFKRSNSSDHQKSAADIAWSFQRNWEGGGSGSRECGAGKDKTE